MARKPNSIVRPVEEPSEATYQCPGCSETVDSRNIADVLAHHQHVLRPTAPLLWFQQTLEAARFASGPSRSEAKSAAPREQIAASPDARWRRYGHEQHTNGRS